jgi:hypothetical protein
MINELHITTSILDSNPDATPSNAASSHVYTTHAAWKWNHTDSRSNTQVQPQTHANNHAFETP